MTTKKKIKGQAWWTGVAISTLAFGGCSKIAEVAELGDSSSVKVSGAFGSVVGGLSREMNRSLARSLGGGVGGAASVALPAGLSVYCVTFSKPPTSGEGAIGSDGKFSVTVSGAKGKKMGCFVVDADGEKKATLVIKDSSQKSVDGADKKSDSTAFNSNADLGTLSLDLDKGEVEIPIDQIVAEGAASGDSPIASSEAPADAVDFSGDYVIAALDFELPEGYLGPCSGQECHGPPLGQALYMKRINGLVAGTSEPVYGIQLWEGSHASVQSSCNVDNVLGITSSDATAMGVDLSSYGSALQAFTFASSVVPTPMPSASPSPVPLVDGWKLGNATLKWDLRPDCGPLDIADASGTLHAWQCVDGSGDKQIHLGGGCVETGTENPVQPDSWQNISCPDAPVASTEHSGFYIRTCSGTNIPVQGVNKNVTCVNEEKFVASNGDLQSPSSNTFDWTYVDNRKVAMGTPCNDALITSALDQAKCYADAYYQARHDLEGKGYCLPEIRTDWTKTNVADFIKIDKRPSNLIFMEKLDYSDANSASFRQERDDFRGVQLNNGWVPCPVHSVGSGTFAKQDDGKILVIYSESEKAASDDEACLAAYPGESREFMFYLQ